MNQGRPVTIRLGWLLFSLMLAISSTASAAFGGTDWARIVSQVFRRDPAYIEDETAGFVHTPNYRWSSSKQTNNYGFVEDAPTEIQKKQGSLRILVTGDSHIDGSVGTRENFPNVLESIMNQKDPSRFYEVINGGVGLYTFTNYAGLLKKFLFLKPDIYVVVIYLGNDFIGIAKGLAAGGEIESDRPESYKRALNRATRTNPGAMNQHLNQTFYFKNYPETWPRILEVSFSALDDIMVMSKEHDIRIIFLLLPTKIMTESAEASGVKDVSTALGVTLEEIRAFDEKAKRAIREWITSRQGEYLDLTEAMIRDPRELFAKRDHHLNVAGHQALAELFYDRFGEDLLNWRKVEVTTEEGIS